MSGVPPRPDLGRPEDGSTLPPATWRAIEALPVGLIALGATAVVSAIITRIVAPGLSGNELLDDPRVFTLANLTQESLLLVTLVLWVRHVSHAPLQALGIPRAFSPLDLGVGVAVGIGMVFGGGIVLQIVHAIVDNVAGHTVKNPDQIPTTVTGGWLAVSGVVVVILAPLAEESFFRGFLFRGLRRRLRLWPAALMSGAVFGLVHYSELRSLLIIPALIGVGIVLALVYERRQSLVASVATHATFNLIGFLFIAFRR
jgi:uncharacterized protein